MIDLRDHPIELQTLSGEPIAVGLTRCEIRPERVRLSVRLRHADLLRALREGLFHLEGEGEPEAFDPERAVTLELRLRAPWVDGLPDDAESLVARFESPASPLAHSEAWLATEMLQQSDLAAEIEGVTALQVGERTRWAEPLGDRAPRAVRTEPVIALLETFLRSEDWPLTRQQPDLLSFPAGVDEERSWVVLAFADEEVGTLTLFSIHPAKVPPELRADAALRLVALNHKIGHHGKGCFDLEPNTGELRYRSTSIAPDLRLIAAGIHDHLETMASSFDAVAELAG